MPNIGKFIGTEIRIRRHQGAADRREWGSYCLMGTEFLIMNVIKAIALYIRNGERVITKQNSSKENRIDKKIMENLYS